MAIDVKLIISAVDRASGTLKKVGGSLSAFNKQSKNITARFKDIGKNAAIATAGIATIGAGAYKLASDAAKFESIQDAFRGMTKGMIKDQDAFLKKVKEASADTLSSLDIMRGGTRALALIGKQSFTNFGDDFAKMAMLSKKAARATGQDVNFMFDSLILGVSRSSKLILDNLGITLDMAEAQSKYKDEIMATTGATETSAEKSSLLRVAMEELDKTYKDVEVTAGGLAGAQQKMRATLDDLKIEVGKELLPVFNDLVRMLIPLLKEHVPKLSRAISELIKKFSGLPKPVKVIILGLATLLPLVTALGAIAIPVGAAISALGTIIGLLASPIGIVIAATAAFIASIKRMIDNLRRFKEEVKRVIDSIKNIISSFRPRIKIGIELPDIAGAWESLKQRAHDIGVPGFQTGGIVPGSPAQARLAVVHGGERVIPHGGGGGVGGDGITININAGTLISTRTEVREFAKMMYDELANLARAQRKTVDELINWQP